MYWVAQLQLEMLATGCSTVLLVSRSATKARVLLCIQALSSCCLSAHDSAKFPQMSVGVCAETPTPLHLLWLQLPCKPCLAWEQWALLVVPFRPESGPPSTEYWSPMRCAYCCTCADVMRASCDA